MQFARPVAENLYSSTPASVVRANILCERCDNVLKCYVCNVFRLALAFNRKTTFALQKKERRRTCLFHRLQEE